MTDELKNKIETELVRITYKASGMPETHFKEVEEFCNSHYGGCRWLMIVDLVREGKRQDNVENRLNEMQMQINSLTKPKKAKVIDVKYKTFGSDENGK